MTHYQIHRVNGKFSVTRVRELEEEQLQGYEELARFDEYNEAMEYATSLGDVAVDFDVLVNK